MPSLFTHAIAFDDGNAPTPFSGMCPLAVCKPVTVNSPARQDRLGACIGDDSDRMVPLPRPSVHGGTAKQAPSFRSNRLFLGMAAQSPRSHTATHC